jgi:LuxR family transcriptional regulator, maltose regulon positive regulatory protein
MPAHGHAADASADEKGTPRPSQAPNSLTDRELDVLRYLPTRLSTTEIAGQLGISANTVKTHLKNIYQKLGARSRNEAIVKAAQLHVIHDVSTALVTQLAKGSPALVPE